MSKVLEIFLDGASSGNPGPSAIGVVIKENDQIIKELSIPIGNATNNIAEYTAFIYALQEALILKAEKIRVYTDSELLYNQWKGLYKVNHPNLKPLFDQIQHLVSGLQNIELLIIPREQNKEADALAKKAIKKEQARVVAFPSLDGREESPSSEG